MLVAAEVGVHSDGRGLGQRHISVAAMREMPTAMMVWLPQGGSDVMGNKVIFGCTWMAMVSQVTTTDLIWGC